MNFDDCEMKEKKGEKGKAKIKLDHLGTLPTYLLGFLQFSGLSEGGWIWIWWLLRFWNGKEMRHLHHGLGFGINFDTSTLLAFRKIPILETARKGTDQRWSSWDVKERIEVRKRKRGTRTKPNKQTNEKQNTAEKSHRRVTELQTLILLPPPISFTLWHPYATTTITSTAYHRSSGDPNQAWF